MAAEHELPECTFPVGPNEEERIALLHSFGILDTKPGEEFDRLTGLVRRVLDVPIALVSLVDSKRQWFKSNLGLEGCPETHRNLAFCAHAILPTAPDVFVVLDSKLDNRFKDNDLVTGPPYLRFYAGAPLRVTTPEGKVLNIGTVCALDQKPRESFGVRDKQFLLDIAGIVVSELEAFQRQRSAISEESQRYITCTSHELKTPLMVLKLATATFKEHFQRKEEEARAQRRASLQIKNSAMTSRSMSEAGREAEDMLEVVDQAELAAEMMEQMISNAIDSAREKWTGGTSGNVCIGPVNLRKVVHLTERLSNRYHSEFVKFDIEFDDNVPNVIQSDGHLLRRCLVNIVSNAFKYAAETKTSIQSPACGGRPSYDMFWETVAKELPASRPVAARVLIKARVLFKQKKENFVDRDDLRIDFVGDEDEVSELVKFIRVEIHDTGSGVPPELQNKLFRESFVHADMTSTESPDYNVFLKRQGSGLGLFVANICVKELGGTIGYRSKNGVTSPGDGLDVHQDLPDPDLGTVFWFDFPFKDSSAPHFSPKFVTRSPSSKMQEDLLDFHELMSQPETMKLSDAKEADEALPARKLSPARNKSQSPSDPDSLAFPSALPQPSNTSVEQPQQLNNTSVEQPQQLNNTSVEQPQQPLNNTSVEQPQQPLNNTSVEQPQQPPNKQRRKSRSIQVAVPDAPKKRLLVVDDSVMIQKLLTMNLLKLNFEVDTALNGREGLEKMMNEEYLVVFMDFLMPVLDGISATSIFRDWERTIMKENEEKGESKQRDHQYIMGMSANAEESDKVAAYEAGIDHFIPKPVVMKDLSQVIGRVSSGSPVK